MSRDCPRCSLPLAPTDLVREDTTGMEAERAAAGLEGIRFLYFRCSHCTADTILVGIIPGDGEFVEDYEARRAGLEEVVRGFQAGPVAAAVIPILAP